jgi:hypothetical protein
MADTPAKPARTVPLGKALAWTDDDLDRLSAVTPEDIAAAQEWWRRNAPARYAKLLDAQEAENAAAQ